MTPAPRDPIDCEAAIDNLYAFLDGELSDELEGAIHQHLDQCRHCFPQFEIERNFLRFLEARARALGAPAHVRRRIFEAILLGSDRPETPER